MKAREINKDVEGYVCGDKACVYVIENQHGQVKIGRSADPDRRIRVIETQGCIDAKNVWISPVCTNTSIIEGSLHKIFDSSRIKGEWFGDDFVKITAKKKPSIQYNNKETAILEFISKYLAQHKSIRY